MHMPDADPTNSMHNAFVQDFLSRWREKFIGEVIEGPGDRFDDSEAIELAIELIQGNYDYVDHEEAKRAVTVGDLHNAMRVLQHIAEMVGSKDKAIYDSLELSYAFLNATSQKQNTQES